MADSDPPPPAVFFPSLIDLAPQGASAIALEPWHGGDNPTLSDVYVVRLIDCNPKAYDIQVRLLPNVNKKQKELGGAELRLAEDPKYEIGHSGDHLDLHFRRNTDSFVIFHLIDRSATFLESLNPMTGIEELAVVRAKTAPNDLLYQTYKVPTDSQDYIKAVSVVMKAYASPGQFEQYYGLGLTIWNGAYHTDIFIDPQIKNDGNGLP